nr:hypothetical protein [Tanacetum cinerariifolium]
MSTPKFVTTHNLIAFLEKPSESDGFKQIVVFVNANQIKYALTMSPTIYTLCITQFWTTVKIKIVNDDVRLQALIDGKKFVINEASIRHNLKLNDEEGTSCLSNAVIFEELARIGAKTTSWNEFSSIMASAIICLANNEKFNFSKYILTSLGRKIDDIDSDVEVNLENVYNLDMAHEEIILSMQDVDVQSERIEDVVKDVVATTKMLKLLMLLQFHKFLRMT